MCLSASNTYIPPRPTLAVVAGESQSDRVVSVRMELVGVELDRARRFESAWRENG